MIHERLTNNRLKTLKFLSSNDGFDTQLGLAVLNKYGSNAGQSLVGLQNKSVIHFTTDRTR